MRATPPLHWTPGNAATDAAVQSIAKSDVPAVFGKFSEPLVFGCAWEPDANSALALSESCTGNVGPPVLGPITNAGLEDALPIGPAGCTWVYVAAGLVIGFPPSDATCAPLYGTTVPGGVLVAAVEYANDDGPFSAASCTRYCAAEL